MGNFPVALFPRHAETMQMSKPVKLDGNEMTSWSHVIPTGKVACTGFRMEIGETPTFVSQLTY